MNVLETPFAEVRLLAPRVFGDDRGEFLEVWNQRVFQKLGLPVAFAQDNLSVSRRGVLRGLHFQHPNSQGKLISAVHGEIFDVAVDIRRGSPTFGKWMSVLLSSENRHQLYIPEGFAHGFCVLSEMATVLYKATDFYHPSSEATLRWDDPEVGVAWPIRDVLVSPKDASGQTLGEFPEDRLPRYNKL